MTESTIENPRSLSGMNHSALSSYSVDADVERLLQYTQQKFGQDQIVQAKEDFFWLMGKVFHDDDFYEARMTYFLDTYLFERPIRTNNRTLNSPLYLFKDETPIGFEITSFRHSLFHIKRLNAQKVLVNDLLEGQSFEVHGKPGESFKHLENKQILQGFVYRTKDQSFWSKGIIYHPIPANSIILRSVKQFQNDPNISFTKILGLFAKQNLRYLRQGHNDPKKIYSEQLS